MTDMRHPKDQEHALPSHEMPARLCRPHLLVRPWRRHWRCSLLPLLSLTAAAPHSTAIASARSTGKSRCQWLGSHAECLIGVASIAAKTCALPGVEILPPHLLFLIFCSVMYESSHRPGSDRSGSGPAHRASGFPATQTMEYPQACSALKRRSSLYQPRFAALCC